MENNPRRVNMPLNQSMLRTIKTQHMVGVNKSHDYSLAPRGLYGSYERNHDVDILIISPSTPLLRTGSHTTSIFKWSSASLNSKFFFSWTGCPRWLKNTFYPFFAIRWAKGEKMDSFLSKNYYWEVKRQKSFPWFELKLLITATMTALITALLLTYLLTKEYYSSLYRFKMGNIYITCYTVPKSLFFSSASYT